MSIPRRRNSQGRPFREESKAIAFCFEARQVVEVREIVGDDGASISVCDNAWKHSKNRRESMKSKTGNKTCNERFSRYPAFRLFG